ncbi:Multiple substrate aminotransferase [Acidilobus saccharovorans 345-15]|uniref:Multiple substrate aminotransferase n=1 Tax=Acidilobus saccharovorans (strain DSM 16705 / JCM 18335 / VKM B-2471 / 345-15) TaxID=666510 RepID=D9Q0D5_ACIS3|nr:Multiple substrate aminotransferase [Acidilobus saccharovorans 345-15]
MIDVASKFSSGVKSLRPSEIREILALTENKKVLSLAGGLPGPEVFPKEELAAIASRVIEELGDSALQYSPTLGVMPFREAVADFVRGKGVKVTDNDRVAVTTGSQEAIYLLAMTLINPGDGIIVESPTYLAALNVFRYYGANFISIPLDENGMRTDLLEDSIKKAKEKGINVKMIYTVATCHNPTGVIMSDDRRKELMEIASKYDLLVIEDDPYSFFVFDDDVNFTHLKTMDDEGRVIYLGTFSKILAPGLRLGYMIADRQLVRAVELAKQMVDLHSSTLSQYIALYAIKEGVVDRTIEKARKSYREKRDVMIEALEEYMPDGSHWFRPRGGLFAFIYLPEGVDTSDMLQMAIDRGVAYVPGRSFFSDGSGANAMRINFSYLPPDKLREGIRIIANTAVDYLKAKGKVAS